MISTQRLLLITLILNIMLTISSDIYMGQTIDYEATTNEVRQIEAIQADIEGPEDWVAKSQNPQSDNAIWNMGRMFGKLAGLFLRSMNPIPINGANYTTGIEQSIAYMLTLLRSMIYIIMAIETWSYFVNKKGT